MSAAPGSRLTGNAKRAIRDLLANRWPVLHMTPGRLVLCMGCKREDVGSLSFVYRTVHRWNSIYVEVDRAGFIEALRERWGDEITDILLDLEET